MVRRINLLGNEQEVVVRIAREGYRIDIAEYLGVAQDVEAILVLGEDPGVAIRRNAEEHGREHLVHPRHVFVRILEELLAHHQARIEHKLGRNVVRNLVGSGKTRHRGGPGVGGVLDVIVQIGELVGHKLRLSMDQNWDSGR